MASPLEYLLGPTLKGKGGTDVATSSLNAAYVGIYFSAHWCPPCRGFTPELAKFYNANAKAKDLEIVFASSDKDQAAFDEYFAEMPWLALPYGDRALKDKLSKKYGVSGIPTLVIVDAKTGELVTKKARGNVSKDPKAEHFPWKPKSFAEIMDESNVVLKDGSTVAASDAAQGKGVLALYFSASWCPPCRSFTPKLAKWVEEHKPAEVEVFFISADRDEASFKDYHKKMPFPAFEFAGSAKDELGDMFDVGGYPTLLFVDAATGKVIHEDGRSRVEAEPAGYPWPPKPVEDLDVGLGSINDGKIALLLLDKVGDDAAVKQVEAFEAFEAVAKEEFAAAAAVATPADAGGNKDECAVAGKEVEVKAAGDADADEAESSIKFTVARAADDMAPRLRQFFGLDNDADGTMRLIVTDIPSRSKYVHAGALSAEAVRSFIGEVKAGTAHKVDLKAAPKAAAL